MNNINNNLYGKTAMKLGNESKQIQNNVLSEIDTKEMPKQGFGKLNNLQNTDIIKTLTKIQEDTKRAELIAIKIVKQETVTTNEQNFISKRYPDMKQVANQSISECVDLKEKISNCKTDEQRQQVLFKATSDIKDMTKKGAISEIQARIKNSGIEEVEKFLKNIEKEVKKAEIIAIKIVKGHKLTTKEENFITKKYPDIKQIAAQSINDKVDLKEKLKSCKTPEEKQLVLAKAINDLKDMAKRGGLSETEIIVKMSVIEVVKKEDEREYDKEYDKEKGLKFIINPYIYLNSGLLSDKLSGVIIIAVILSIVYFLKN